MRYLSATSDATTDRVSSRVSEGAFRQLIEIAPEAVAIHQDGHFVYANQAAADQLGVSDPGAVIGCQVADFIVPADREKIAAVTKQLYDHGEGGESHLKRFRRLRPDGSTIDVETVAITILWEGRSAILSMGRDVSARVTAEERVRDLLSTGIYWLWETDTEHRFSYVSEKADNHPLDHAFILGKTRWELVGEYREDAKWREHAADLDTRQPFDNFEYWSRTPSGREFCVSVSGTPSFDNDGTFRGYRGIACDTTKRRQAERTIEHMALHDALTKLPNRTLFAKELERECSIAKRDGVKLAVLFLDLDHFKDINDSYGHSVGDKLLVQVADRLQSCDSGGGLVARFGGDEFLMIASQPYHPATISWLVNRIARRIAEPFDIDGLTVQTSISIGIASYPDDALDAERILANADLALYAAKGDGRNTWRIFDRHLQDQLQAQRSLDQELRHALDHDQFELYYQPVIDIADGRVSGFEALIRWKHPKHGEMLPDCFIPTMERNKLVVPLTDWVLREAAAQLKRWEAIGLSSYKVSVNVSPVLLRLQGFVALFDGCIAEVGCDPRCIVIEITEGALIDEAKAIPVLTALRERGVTVAVDDFGVGYSSMARLRLLPVDVLKIDRSFLTKVNEEAGDASIVESLVNIGHSLEKKVVAEGVERMEQYSFLNKIGCDYAQGFLINHPMTASEVPIWLDRWPSSAFC